jgi:aspartate/methionine/tyrosine aminotransferase
VRHERLSNPQVGQPDRGPHVIAPSTLAERVRTLAPSATVEMAERVRAARAQGRSIIALSSGDPNLPTDPRIVEAAARAMRAGATHYSAALGEPALREAIARREAARAGAGYAPEDILVTPGGKFALLTALMGLISPGDDVLVLQPGWVSYGPCIRLAGGRVVPVPALDIVDAEAIASRLTPATRAIIVNSPVNPTGRILTAREIGALVDLGETHNIWILFDQVYADFAHAGRVTYPQTDARGFARTLVIDSFSKSFGMTGWRMGYLAMPPGLSASVVKFVQHSIYCVPAFLQAAAVEALSLAPEIIPAYRARFRARIDRALGRLTGVAGLSCAPPEAGFFLFPRVAGDDVQIARAWLDERDLAVLPGSAFGEGGAGHLRISLTASDDELATAFERMAGGVRP